MPSFPIERMLAPFFPRLAEARVAARLRTDMMLRAYDAAKPSRATKNWRAPSTSAASEDAPALEVLRNRSRDLVRNNPWGKKIRRQLPAHMVGTGVTPRVTQGADRTRSRALSAYNAWADETDIEGGTGFAGQQALASGTLVESGEALVHWTPDANAAGGWTTRVLEPDYLDHNFHETSRNGSGKIVSGVEFDARGRRVAYHIFQDHPGDVMPMLPKRSSRIRVPAEFMDHVFERLRPGQVRGIPWLAVSAMGLHDLGDYREAERWRKKITAALAAFVITNAPPAQSALGSLSTASGPDGEQRAIERIAPGTIKRLRPGEDVKFSDPPGDSGAGDHIMWELLAICAGVGVPFAEMTGDLRNANYSSMRLGKIEFWALLDVWQWLMLQPQLLRRAWARVQAASGVPGMPVEWSFPKRVWVDPEKDANAEIKAIRAGLKSQPEAIAERGYDWREVLAEQKAYLVAVDREELVVDTDPRRVAASGARNDTKASAGDADAAAAEPAAAAQPE